MKVITMVNIFQLPLVADTKKTFLENLLAQLSQPTQKPLVIFTPNPEQIVLAQERPAFQQVLLQADYLLPDGIGLVGASQFLRNVAQLRGKNLPALPARIAGVEVVSALLQQVKPAWPILLVGGRGYDATTEQSVPLKVTEREVTWFTGYQSLTGEQVTDDRNLQTVLQELKPKVVFVAFGAPAQETWIIAHREMLQKAGVRLVMAVGGSFDILTGKLPRAPKIWQQLGLEWLFRLMQEPSRWQRQLKLLTFVEMTLEAAGKILTQA